MADEEKEEYMGKLAEDDKTEERYKALNEDSKIDKQDAWISKITGDLQPYTKGEGTVTYAVNVIKSVRWPGHYTLSKGGKFMSIYIGDCIKRGAFIFNPIEPPDVPLEDREPIEEPEPNGKFKVEKPPGEDEEKEDE